MPLIEKPIFIYALHRSGSTYLKNIINASNEIEMLKGEVHFDHPFFFNTFKKYYLKYCNNQKERYDKFLNILATDEVRGAFWNNYKSEFTDFSKSKNYLDEPLTIWNSFNSVLKHILDKSAKKRIGIKYPTHFTNFQDFNTQYDSCKNIFLIRDPRAILASKIMSPTNERLNSRDSFAYEFFRMALVIYISLEFIFFVKKMNSNINYILMVKYENLILNKKKQLKQICKYCEFDMQPELFEADGKTTGYGIARSEDERINRWTTVLRSYEKKIVDFITKRHRIKLDYE